MCDVPLGPQSACLPVDVTAGSENGEKVQALGRARDALPAAAQVKVVVAVFSLLGSRF